MTSSETPQSLHCLSTIADKLGICSSLSNLNNNSSASSPSAATTNSPVVQKNNIIASQSSSNNSSQLSLVVSSSTVVRTATNSAPPSPSSSSSSSTATTAAASIGGVNNHCQPQAHHQQQLQTNGSSPTKITENHLSTKLHRSTSAPYPNPRAHLATSNQSDQSNHSIIINGSNGIVNVTGVESSGSGLLENHYHHQVDSSSIIMLDDVSQLESSIINPNHLPPHNNLNNNNISIADSDYTGESNGNCILDFNNTTDNHHSSSPCLSSGDININSNHSECPSLSTTPSDLQLDSGGSPCNNIIIDDSSTMPSGPTNGMTSPGGSLDENDCDNKVINGDTLSPGDVPDPDAIKMFVGQVPKDLSESELRSLFEEFGPVYQINVLRDKSTKQSKGCCFVTFYTRKAALAAQNALHNVKTLAGMNHPIQMKPADNENRYERKLFVGMLSRKCNEQDVRTMFSRYGIIDECTVLRDSNGQSKGCAFVTFASKQCAQNAIKAVHHSVTMEGCSSPIVVKFADTQKDKDAKRQQQLQASLLNNLTTAATVNPIAPHYFSSKKPKLQSYETDCWMDLLSKNNAAATSLSDGGRIFAAEILQTLSQQQQQQHQQQQQQQQHQQQQNSNYFGQLSQLATVGGIAGLSGLTSPGGPAGMQAALSSSHASAPSSTDLATLAALANLTNVATSPSSLSLGVQNLAALTSAMGGSHSALSPSDFGVTGANAGTLGTGNPLANLAGTGFHTGLSSYTTAMRSAAMKQPVNLEGPEGANLFIYHLPPECGDQELAAMFSGYGNVISAKVFIDKQTNLSKCFGFVSYDNAMSAQLAIQTMNGFQVGMKRLKVQLKRTREAAKPY